MRGRKHSLLSPSCLPHEQVQTLLVNNGRSPFILTVDEGGWHCYYAQSRIMIETFIYECYNVYVDKSEVTKECEI